MSKTREIRIAPSALNLMETFAPTDDERKAIYAVLNVLKKVNPDTHQRAEESGLFLGYKISFLQPQTYRVDVGRFRIHYRFDDEFINVGFIGVY